MVSNLAPLKSPSHIGIVVENLTRTSEAISSTLNLGKWDIVDYAPQREDIKIGELFSLQIAFLDIGSTRIELLQPVTGKSIWSEFLNNHGEMMHHLSFKVSNWDENVARIQEQGAKMVAGGLFFGKRWAYFDTGNALTVVELEEETSTDKATWKLWK